VHSKVLVGCCYDVTLARISEIWCRGQWTPSPTRNHNMNLRLRTPVCAVPVLDPTLGMGVILLAPLNLAMLVDADRSL
jgi:hypothetical protein